MRATEFLPNRYSEEETSTVTHDGEEYSVNKLLRISDNLQIHSIPVSALTWNIDPTSMDPHRIYAADPNVPVLITPYEDQLTVIDGAHRIAKAMQTKLPTIRCKYISPGMLSQCKK